MNIKQIYAAYWSPTGNTRKIARMLAGELAEELDCPMELLDFTLPKARESAMTFSSEDLVVFCTPTYAGKVPNKILPYIQEQVLGNGALAIPVVTFGNRNFDNSLAELSVTLKKNDFHLVAAAAFACRHAFTDELAFGRPDTEDETELKDFAKKAACKIRESEGVPLAPEIPGDSDAPYYIPKGVDGQPVQFLKAKPQTDLSKCTNCGACARQCPMGAIDLKNVANTPGTCIKCQRCVRICTKHAKYFDDKAFLSHVAMLEENFSEPKENQTFF